MLTPSGCQITATATGGAATAGSPPSGTPSSPSSSPAAPSTTAPGPPPDIASKVEKALAGVDIPEQDAADVEVDIQRTLSASTNTGPLSVEQLRLKCALGRLQFTLFRYRDAAQNLTACEMLGTDSPLRNHAQSPADLASAEHGKTELILSYPDGLRSVTLESGGYSIKKYSNPEAIYVPSQTLVSISIWVADGLWMISTDWASGSPSSVVRQFDVKNSDDKSHPTVVIPFGRIHVLPREEPNATMTATPAGKSTPQLEMRLGAYQYLPAGQYDVRLKAPGFQDRAQQVNVTSGEVPAQNFDSLEKIVEERPRDTNVLLSLGLEATGLRVDAGVAGLARVDLLFVNSKALFAGVRPEARYVHPLNDVDRLGTSVGLEGGLHATDAIDLSLAVGPVVWWAPGGTFGGVRAGLTGAIFLAQSHAVGFWMSPSVEGYPKASSRYVPLFATLALGLSLGWPQ